MHYGLEIYCVNKPESVQGVSGRGWQVLVPEAQIVDEASVSELIGVIIPGIRYLARVYIVGDAPAKAHQCALKIAHQIARRHRGVVFDPQQGALSTPRGLKRYLPQGTFEKEDLFCLSWFFLDDRRFASQGLDEFLELLRKRLPEALPKRYGLVEPPPHSLQRDGLDHFRGFLRDHLRDLVIWTCTKPFQSIDISLPDHVGPSLRGFRCCRVTASVSSQALSAPGWPLELKRFWLEAAIILEPFYAEVRRDSHSGISAWWWNGIPPEAPVSALAGPPYLDLWPEFKAKCTLLNEKWGFIDLLATDHPEGLEIPPPPLSIAQPPDCRIECDPVTGEVLSKIKLNDIQYPPVWPFQGPRAPPDPPRVPA